MIGMKEDQTSIRSVLLDTIALLCKNSLTYNCSLKIEGLLGITIDENDIILVNVDRFFNSTRDLISSQGIKQETTHNKSDFHNQTPYSDSKQPSQQICPFKSNNNIKDHQHLNNNFPKQGNKIKMEPLLKDEPLDPITGFSAFPYAQPVQPFEEGQNEDELNSGFSAEDLYELGPVKFLPENEEDYYDPGDENNAVYIEDDNDDGLENGISNANFNGTNNNYFNIGGFVDMKNNSGYLEGSAIKRKGKCGLGRSEVKGSSWTAANHLNQTNLNTITPIFPKIEPHSQSNNKIIQRTSKASRGASAGGRGRRINMSRMSGGGNGFVITEESHLCGYPGCLKRFRFRHDLLRHQTKKHGRIPLSGKKKRGDICSDNMGQDSQQVYPLSNEGDNSMYNSNGFNEGSGEELFTNDAQNGYGYYLQGQDCEGIDEQYTGNVM